jgi:hypothetical protein
MSRYLVKAVVLAVFFLRTLLSLAQSRSPSLLKSILGKRSTARVPLFSLVSQEA